MNKIDTLQSQLLSKEERLRELEHERDSLLIEIKSLQNELHQLTQAKQLSLEPKNESILSPINNQSPPEVKIALFRSLFRGREDVYPKRWENRSKGTSGYSPACKNEWIRGLCNKPKIKCNDCSNRVFLPVTNEVIYRHLTSPATIGVYPLLNDETCWFLAVDFDKESWKDDVSAFLETCKKIKIPAALERSRSGNGGHVWFFFSEPIPAILARKLGSFLITETLESRPEVGLDSYDRFFPNQDTMPQGGLGNLIALPLQQQPREQGNSVFLNEKFSSYEDQWAYLASLERIRPKTVNEIVDKAVIEGKVIGVSLLPEENDQDQPWNNTQTKKSLSAITGPFPKELSIVISNQVYIPKNHLSPSLKNRLIQIAAFQNPEFYKKQAMRLPTFDQPRVIGCAQNFSKYIGLPRGCHNEITELLTSLGIRVTTVDERNPGRPIDYAFQGVLRPEQQEAAHSLLNHDIGVLSAATAFGKTVVAGYLITKRAVNTLIVVHRQQLLEQWISRLSMFLNINPKDIGRIGAGKYQPTGIIDVALMQSLVKDNLVDDIVQDYGYLIIDECHHISAASFEQVARQCKARYVNGLSATVVRKDGRHPIIFMQCGPVRFRTNDCKQALSRPFSHRVVKRETDFHLPDVLALEPKPSIQDIYSVLITDEKRNDRIFDDVLKALDDKRSPVLITERKEHLAYFEERLSRFAKNVIVLQGGMSLKQRQDVMMKLSDIPDNEERIILTTGRYLGEGFDDARLDTLFLTMPISWKGTLAQYAGRLHREHDQKKEVIIYDYVDPEVPMLLKMWKRRIKGYQVIGYRIENY
ncbi:MAG: TOTE conflict system archaeo-eukaryotic primase domain-containing protein [Bacteroidota bacterium]